MDKRQSIRGDECSIFSEIISFKNAYADMAWANLESPQKSNHSIDQKQIDGKYANTQLRNLSMTTTLQAGSFSKNEERVYTFKKNPQEMKEASKRRRILSQKAYEELRQFYLTHKQEQKQMAPVQHQNILEKKFFYSSALETNRIQESQAKQQQKNELNQLRFTEFTKLNEEDELILILKFLLGRTGNSIPWNILPITEQQAYAYIEQNQEHLANLYESKLDIYMKNIIKLYLHPNKTIATLFLNLFKKYGMKFDVWHQVPDFWHERVRKGMFGFEFVAVPYDLRSNDELQLE